MWLQLINEHGLGEFLSLLEKHVDGRDDLSVCNLEVLEFRVRMFLYLLSIHVAVVIYDEDSV